MPLSTLIIGEALMDCITQADGTLLPLMGGSPFNMARAAALQGADVGFLPPFSSDTFGERFKAQCAQDGIHVLGADSACPTSLAVVTLRDGQPSYGFYREGIADRDYDPETVLEQLRKRPAGVLHTGSLMLVPPEHQKVLRVVEGAKAMGWIISVDVNLRPRVAPDLAAYKQAVLAVLPHADWVKASDEDLEILGFGGATLANASQARAAFAHPANRHVALTFGGEGAYLWVEGQEVAAAAPRVVVQDTVGAGDTFWGSCIADWSTQTEGRAQRVHQTLRRAMTAAAINCARKGCQPPTLQEVEAELAAQG
jgi:fructokinase